MDWPIIILGLLCKEFKGESYFNKVDTENDFLMYWAWLVLSEAWRLVDNLLDAQLKIAIRQSYFKSYDLLISNILACSKCDGLWIFFLIGKIISDALKDICFGRGREVIKVVS